MAKGNQINSSYHFLKKWDRAKKCIHEQCSLQNAKKIAKLPKGSKATTNIIMGSGIDVLMLCHKGMFVPQPRKTKQARKFQRPNQGQWSGPYQSKQTFKGQTTSVQ